jgi:hypothetical protein
VSLERVLAPAIRAASLWDAGAIRNELQPIPSLRVMKNDAERVTLTEPRLRVEGQAMRTWLRSVIDAIFGRRQGKTGRLDTATRMAMDADFGDRHASTPPELRRSRERDDRHLFKARAPSPVGPHDELIRMVDEAQERDAEDERRLYRRPMSGSRRMRRGKATDR